MKTCLAQFLVLDLKNLIGVNISLLKLTMCSLRGTESIIQDPKDIRNPENEIFKSGISINCIFIVSILPCYPISIFIASKITYLILSKTSFPCRHLFTLTLTLPHDGEEDHLALILSTTW